MNGIFKVVRDKLMVTFSVVVFLLLIVQLFLESNNENNIEITILQLSIIMGFNILSFLFLYGLNEKSVIINFFLEIIEFLLNLNLICISGIIIFLANIHHIEELSIVFQITSIKLFNGVLLPGVFIVLPSIILVFSIASFLISLFIKFFYNEKKTRGRIKMKILKNIMNWIKITFSVKRFAKALIFAVTIGLGAYLGKIFLQMHWLLALVFVTLFLMIFAGKFLDVLFNWD